MDITKSTISGVTDIRVSQILIKAGFRQAETCGRIVIYEIWSEKAGANIKIACDDLLEVWYDQYHKKGGTILELVKHWWNVNETIAIHKLYLLKQELARHKRPRKNVAVKIPHYVIEDVRDLGTNHIITDYLLDCGFLEQARALFKEVYYYTTDFKGVKKEFCAAACQNSKYGWQVLNKHYNGCIGNESQTFLKNCDNSLTVFENQFNYLQWLKDNAHVNHSAIILNTPKAINEAIQTAINFPQIDLYFSASPFAWETLKLFKGSLPYVTHHIIK